MTEVQGFCDERFRAVKAAVTANFSECGDIGASVAADLWGKPVVDLREGHADRAMTRPWERDTIASIYSSTRGLTARCAHLLAERGELDLEAPVASFWPEFAAAAKEGVTVHQPDAVRGRGAA
jgi:CubicO group peptidase (beta-lactamase class C family)